MRASHALAAAMAVAGVLVVGSGASAVASATPAAWSPGGAPLSSKVQVGAVASQGVVSSGDPVVVDGLTTPTELTTVMPDGSMRLELSSRPVRVRQGEAWVPVDTDLVASDGWWVPVASAVPVRFGAGGSDALAGVQAPDGSWVTETWPYGVLPVPVVEGDTATYAEVLPGVDLKLVATRTGKASIFVVKSAEAARAEALAALHVTVGGADLVQTGNGAVVADVGGVAADAAGGRAAVSRALGEAAAQGKRWLRGRRCGGIRPRAVRTGSRVGMSR